MGAPVVLAGLLPAALMPSACGDEGGFTPEPPLAADELEAAYRAAYCDRVGPCCESAGLSADAATCSGYLGLAALMDAVERGAAVYDAVAARSCVQQMQRLAESCVLGFPEACGRVALGSRGAGEACLSGWDCEAGTVCSGPDGAARCVEFSRGSEGAACQYSCRRRLDLVSCEQHATSPEGAGVECHADDGLYCASDGSCQPLAQLGAACEPAGCAEGAACDPSSAACEPARRAGEPCAQDAECDADTFCDEQGGRCVAPRPDGSACQAAYECTGACSGGLCVDPAGLDPRVCGP